jgi:phage gp29-like protein
VGIWQSISGLFSRAPAEPSVVYVGSDEPVIQEQQLWLQFQRIGGNLTPQQVSQIIIEADGGHISRFVDLANEARQKDGHLHSVLQTRELAVKGLEWSIEPPEKANGKEKRAARNCEAALRNSENLPDLIHHLSGAGPYHGHAHAETMWKKSGRWVVPDRWKLIHPRRFIFAQADGSLVFTDTGIESEAIDLIEAFPGKFIRYQPIVNGDARVREGLARILVWLALFRNWDLRDWLQLGEIGWKPWRIGKYTKEADKRDIEILKRVLRTLGTTGAAAIPDTTELNIEWPKGTMPTGGRSNHRELFDCMGAEMSKAVLGQTLTTEQGDRGSQSLGNVQDRVRGDILAADAIGEASAITRHIVRPFYQLNEGSTVRPGYFRFKTEDAVDLVQFTTAMKNLAGKGGAGLRVPASWVRKQGGIPDPKEGEETIGGALEEKPPGSGDGEDAKQPD